MRMLLAVLDAGPAAAKTGRGAPAAPAANAEEESALLQLTRHVSSALRRALLLADSEARLLEVIDQGLLPMVSAQFFEQSRGMDMRTVAVLEALCGACVHAGEGFRSTEAKVTKPLLHLLGNHPNPLVQLHAVYCLRVVAGNSPSQLFPLMNLLLNQATVQNAELLGTPTRPRAGSTASAGSATPAAVAAAAGQLSDSLQPLVRGLFGHCAALAALASELRGSALGVPHDVATAVLSASRALLQPHGNATVSAQRRSCAFILLEGLMCLGADWVGQRLTTLFTLWKAALGKKPVDRARVLHQQYAAAAQMQDAPGAAGGKDAQVAAAAEAAGASCREELMSLLCALRSLQAFTLHSNPTLLVTLPHLHKILVVFLTNISQLVVALPHPAAAARARGRGGGDSAKPTIALAARCGIPEVLQAIRSTMYRTFAAMKPTQYSSRFVPLLNMLADDVTRPLPSDFPVCEFLTHNLTAEDTVLDLADPYTDVGKEGAASVRLAASLQLASHRLTGNAERSERRLAAELPDEAFAEGAAAAFFGPPPREGLNGTEALLTPWDARHDVSKMLAAQSVSMEWEWRCSAVYLLATIMNSAEVNEAPKAAVLLHLLKRREEPADPAQGKRGAAPAPPATAPAAIVANIAVLRYLREHIRVWGASGVPPANPVEQIVKQATEGLRDANPVVRRLNVEILALLFYVHHKQPEATLPSTVLKLITSESSSDSVPGRSAVALLCGAILRVFAEAASFHSPAAGAEVVRPPMKSIVPLLLRLAKDTTQPVRLWMLHSIHLSMQAGAGSFAPYLRDSLRLATAHVLADFYESPLVLWVIAQLIQSASSTVAALDSGGGAQVALREDCVSRILALWTELKHRRIGGAADAAALACSASPAFSTVRCEVLCLATAHVVLTSAPAAVGDPHEVFSLLSTKLAKSGSLAEDSGSPSCAVRTAAAQCIAELVGAGLGLGQPGRSEGGPLAQEPSRLFALLDAARPPECEALRDLVRALIRRRGLEQLPLWLQTLKEIILALPPKGAGGGGASGGAPARDVQDAKAGEDGKDDDGDADDGAAIAGGGGVSNQASAGGGRDMQRFKLPGSATKVFATSCVCLLLEQADPNDAVHFQVDGAASGSPNNRTSRAGSSAAPRLVDYLDTLVALAAQASSYDEASLAAAGVKLMLLIVRLFQNTRDIQSLQDEGTCPLLLVQYEAPMTACVRHNLRPQANPAVVRLALELLRNIILFHACNTPQRLLTLLVQPLSAPTFEPDPLYCEGASTQTFLYRLQCACEILDQEQSAVASQLRELPRWLEGALRDASVLLAGLPLQSVKTYQPSCFVVTDYKAVQPAFRTALPTLLKGVCSLLPCDRATASGAGGRAAGAGACTPDTVTLALGLVALLIADRQGAARIRTDDLRVYLRCIRQALVYAARDGAERGAAVIGLGYFLDLMGYVWRYVFQVPSRCSEVVLDLLELHHAIASLLREVVVVGGRQGTTEEGAAEAPEDDDAAEAAAALAGQPSATGAAGSAERPWLAEFARSSREGREARAMLGAYAIHVVAAALRCPTVTGDATNLAMALETYAWWLEMELPRSLGVANGDRPEDEFAAAVLEVDAEVGAEAAAAAVEAASPAAGEGDGHCPWLWVLFSSPFPLDLVDTHAATVLKHWKTVCGVLSQAYESPAAASAVAAAASAGSADDSQLLYLALVVRRLAQELSKALAQRPADDEAAAAASVERRVVCLFALLVPAVSCVALVLDRMPSGDGSAAADALALQPEAGARARQAARESLAQVRKAIALGIRHPRAKVTQTALSSMQSLLQGRTCGALCPLLLPELLTALVAPVRSKADGGEDAADAQEGGRLEAAWNVLTGAIAAARASDAPERDELARATTQLALRAAALVSTYDADCGGFDGHRAAMARCLVQVARSDQVGMKAELDSLPKDDQQKIQQLIREHMAAAAAEDQRAASAAAGAQAKLASTKIELKIKF
eukprot:TRINITY_DN6909_c0_g1_i1.p1 TRINITY_DN6909_c0_g1~~TRINITY_DN6909_c0_g1_i1.p1  ORF type:complete len:1973 (+),score=518.27 TRINITY_DN6909_c0_g1_i1:921-6839(+)